MKTTDDPKKLLKALLAKETLPFDAAAADAARALAQAPETATREVVEALPEPLALAVLEASVKAKRVELAAALQESPVKALAKGARRALYGLRSAGVAVPDRPRAPPPEPSPAAAEEDEDEYEWLPCWLSPPTGTGERGMLAVRPQKGGLEVAQVVVHDEKGITSLQVAETNRSAYRKQVRELRSGIPIRALEIALEECKAILGEAAGLNLATGTAFPQGTEPLLRHFGISPTQPPPDLPAPLPDDERLATQAAALHQEPEAQGWLPSEEQLKLLAQRIEVVMTSPLQLTPVQREEQIRGVIRGSAAEHFTKAVRKLYARRILVPGRLPGAHRPERPGGGGAGRGAADVPRRRRTPGPVGGDAVREGAGALPGAPARRAVARARRRAGARARAARRDQEPGRVDPPVRTMMRGSAGGEERP